MAVQDDSAEGEPSRSAELTRLLKLTERREPAVVQVTTWVGLGIIEGRLQPGEDLNSVDLARRFGSSRTPVREALMLLEQEGLVDIRARRRPRVASFTLQQIRDIYFVRQHLLGLVGQLVAERATDSDLAELGVRLARMEAQAESGDIDGYFWSHVMIQEKMAEIAGNATLKGILDSLALRTLVLRHASLAQPGRLSVSVLAQVKIIEALQQRDGELAALLLRRATVDAMEAIRWSEWPQEDREEAG